MLYTIYDNSDGTKGFPWAHSLESECQEMRCNICTSAATQYSEPVQFLLERNLGVRWPDVLGNAEGLLVVSKRVLEDWESDGIGNFPVIEATLIEPLPRRMKGHPPQYYALDRKRMCRASIDYEASGLVGAVRCPSCGTVRYDFAESFARHEQKAWPLLLQPGPWKRAGIFTTGDFDFCTQKVVDSAKSHGHTNFCFIPTERGAFCTECIEYQ